MDIFELYDLSDWYRGDFKTLRRLYNDLHSALNNNATQPSKVPIAEPLAAVADYLRDMPMSELSLQQLDVLQHFDVLHLLGPGGADWLETVVRAESYDPATTASVVEKAMTSLNAAQERLAAYNVSVDQIALSRPSPEEVEGRVTVRIGFRNDASIRDVKDWKTSADDWYQIVRGLGLVCGEPPENTKVVGASTGSVILVLSATYAFTKVLASIAKHITGAAKNILELQITVEDLRQKKILTATMAAELKRLQNEVRDKTQETIEAEVKAISPKALDGEKSNALGKAVQKLMQFGEDGGDIDFVAPAEPDAEEEEDESKAGGAVDEAVVAIRGVRNIILAYQQERETVKLLSRDVGNDPQ